MAQVALEKLTEVVGSSALGGNELRVEAQRQPSYRIEHIGGAAAHAGTEVEADLAEHDHIAGGHVLARMVAGAFHDGRGSGVAHRETFARASCTEQLSAGG